MKELMAKRVNFNSAFVRSEESTETKDKMTHQNKVKTFKNNISTSTFLWVTGLFCMFLNINEFCR